MDFFWKANGLKVFIIQISNLTIFGSENDICYAISGIYLEFPPF